MNLPASKVFCAFLDPQDKRKPTLVVDAQPLNQAFGRMSSAPGDVWVDLALLRLARPTVCIFSDGRSAFYKVRLKDSCVMLNTGLGVRACDRMVYGTSFGTGVLAESMGRVSHEVRSLQDPQVDISESADMADFVDDLVTFGQKVTPVVKQRRTTSVNSFGLWFRLCCEES